VVGCTSLSIGFCVVAVVMRGHLQEEYKKDAAHLAGRILSQDMQLNKHAGGVFLSPECKMW
jgi:hypothetical protein